MSYILDALKKAEQQREFGEVPGIDSLHEQPPPRPPRRWSWVLVAVLLLNALVGVGLWWRSGGGARDVTPPTARPTEPISQGVPDRAPGPPVVSQPDPAPKVKPVAPPVEKDSVGAPAAEPAPPAQVIVRRPLRPLPLPAPSPPMTKTEPLQTRQLPAPNPAPPVTTAVPPEVVQLRAPTPAPSPEAEPAWKKLPLWPLVPENIRRQVKERLELNVHVYSEHPRDRFVLFNMKKSREGDQISEGLKLEQITRKGVILAVPNGRFRRSPATATRGGNARSALQGSPPSG